MLKRNLVFILVLAASTMAGMACSFSFPGLEVKPEFIPEFHELQTIELREEVINLPARTEKVDLQINFGAGELTINGGGDALVSGFVKYNIEQFTPRIEDNGDRVEISTGDLEFDYVPIGMYDDLINEWELTLGTSPFDLILGIGAADTDIHLGGTAVENLYIHVGAARFDLDFSLPNLTAMNRFSMEAGAADVHVNNLANSHARDVSIKTGVGETTLNFSGELQEDMYVDIVMAAGHLQIIVQEGQNVEIAVEGALIDIDTRGDWGISGSRYVLQGDGPTITIEIDASVGQVELWVQ